jgi:hypothetical protein
MLGLADKKYLQKFDGKNILNRGTEKPEKKNTNIDKKLEEVDFEDNKLIHFALDQKLWYNGVKLSHSRSGYNKLRRTAQGQWLP